MALIVKAFLEKNGDVKGEIRRFQVPSNSADLYGRVMIKVAEIFSLPENGFELFWQDTDGDFVTFSSTAELREAVRHSVDGVLRIFVRRAAAQEKKKTEGDKGAEKGAPEEKIHHPGIVCDGCESSIYGARYKCVICHDYDLCSACEQKGIHPEHDKFKITHPQTAGGHAGFMPPHFRRWMHRFMKKCPAGQGQWATGGATAAGESPSSSGGESSSGPQPQGPSASANGDEFLNNIGANIAAFLDPFGIDVTYEVHQDGQKKKGQFCTGGKGKSKCGQGSGPWASQWNMFGNAGGCTRMPQGARPSTSTEGEKPAEKAAEQAAEKAAEKAAEQKAREEAERKAREEAQKACEEAHRKALEEAQKACEEAQRKACEEAQRKVCEEAEKAHEEAQRKAFEEAKKAREEAEKAHEEAQRKVCEVVEKAREEAEKAREEVEKAHEEAQRKACKEAEKAREEVEKAREEAEKKILEETEELVRRAHAKEEEMEELLVTIEEEATPKAEAAPQPREASPANSNEDGWTMVNEAEAVLHWEGALATDAVPLEGIYPNLKVTQAVEMMRAMGFNDEGGWLTRLLETTDGDIAQALDTLRLGAQQAGSLS